MRTVFFLFKNLPGHFFNNPVKSSKEVSIVDIPFFSQLISCGKVTRSEERRVGKGSNRQYG